MSTLPTTRISRISLIREFFAPVPMDQMKALTELDREQLASAIARQKGITEEQAGFKFVEY